MTASRKSSKGKKAPSPDEEKIRYTAAEVEQLVQERTGSLEAQIKTLQREIGERKQKGEIISPNDTAYSDLLHGVDIGFLILEAIRDRDGTILDFQYVDVNSATTKVMGRARDEILGQRLFTLYPKVDLRWPDLYTRALQTDQPVHEENYSVTVDRIADVVVYPLGEDRIAILAQDITERKRVDEALRESLETERALLNSSADVALLLDINGTILNINDSYAKVLGTCPHKLIGASIWEVMPPEMVGPRRKYFDQAIQSKQVVRFEEVRNDKWYDSFVNPILSDTGAVARVAIVARDITERKRAEEALQKSEEKFRIVADNTSDWEFWLDPEGRFLYTSPSCERVTGYTVHEFMHNPGLLQEIIHPDDLQEFLKHHQHERLFHSKGDIEFRIIAKNGETKWIHHLCQPVYDKDGYYIGSRGSNRNVTERKQAEDALRESEARYRTLVETLHEGILVLDRDANIVFANPRMEEMVGYTASEVYGKPIFLFTDSKNGEIIRQNIERRKQGFRDSYELEMFRKDGRRLVAAVQVSPLLDKRGSYVGSLASVADITEKRSAEEGLKESEEKFRRTFDQSPIAAALLLPDFTLLRANAALCQMLGYSEQELQQMKFPEFTFPDDVEADLRLATQLAAGEIDQYELDKRYVCKDGAIVWGHLSVRYIRDAEGRVLYVIPMVQDITERKRAEEALIESEEKSRMLIHSSRDGILLNDEEGVILEWNPGMEQITGIPKEEAVGCTLLQVASRLLLDGVRIEDMEQLILAKIAELTQPVPEPSEIPYVEVTIQHPDGSPRFIQAQSFRFTSRGRVLYGAVIRDVTEGKRGELTLKEYADRLKQSNEDLERFAYISSHDLQEPLRAIVSYTQLLERRYKDQLDPDADEYLRFIVDGGKRMQALIHDLLEFSRVNTRGGEFRPTDANTVVEDTLATLRPQAQADGVSITVDLLPTVLADPGQLRQVFQNLISNALKFRNPDVPVEIFISVKKLDGMVEFSVQDNGIGIEPQYFEKIFVIFQRLHAMDKYEGTGIGLAIVKRIIDRHGGRIWVESDPGKGSTFHFTIPAMKHDPSP